MENQRVSWVFYSIVVALWIAGFVASAARFGEASRSHAPANQAAASHIATRN